MVTLRPRRKTTLMNPPQAPKAIRKSPRKAPNIRAVTCQRCFLRMDKHPCHIPKGVRSAVDEALQSTGKQQQDQIRAVHRRITALSRQRNEEKKKAVIIDMAAEEQLHHSLKKALSFEDEPAQAEE
ncbi:hypothetical protein NUU61_005478 [Penicillium alfredii]|uniref:Uncharacterized protein n=1 Tax=Penicillium alfredii TaxID=1506179 RepID=A0A9W9K8N9_9EURO|nr:uncharacterized protein NUU61_005478 [Penicillium alfredii]KAJ5096122.1 hypothetical protein NUU61_005478 [Penicillium alfredii]